MSPTTIAWDLGLGAWGRQLNLVQVQQKPFFGLDIIWSKQRTITVFKRPYKVYLTQLCNYTKGMFFFDDFSLSCAGDAAPGLSMAVCEL